MSKKLTYSRFNNLEPHEKTRVYFSHELNTSQKGGPTFVAQAAFWNNWQLAFSDFASKLESK
jgi:hypothetical protein